MIGFSKSMLGLATISVAISVAKGADLRGSATDVSAPKGKIGLYMNGGDTLTALLATSWLSPFVWSPCAETLDWEVVHYGMTEETSAGNFVCDPSLGGKKNCQYLEAINCLQGTMLPANITSVHAAQGMVMFDTIGRTYPEGMRQFLNPTEIAQVDKCMSSGKGKQLMHEAGVKTRKAITWDIMKTFDLAITFNGEQMKDFWWQDTFAEICKLSGQPQCCHFEAHQQKETNLQVRNVLKLFEQRNVTLSEFKKSHQDNYAIGREKDARLRGSATDVSAPKGKIGLYMNGGDTLTVLLATTVLSPFVWSPCAETLDWEVVHYGMTEETSAGNFVCDPSLGGKKNCQYLEAINCLQGAMLSANTTNVEAAQGMVMFDTIGRTYPEGVTQFLNSTEIAQVDKCVSSGKGKQLMHEAGVKTRKTITWDFKRTFDLAITFNGKQMKDFWWQDTYAEICKLSGQPQCCHFEAHQQKQTNLQVQNVLKLFEQRNVTLSEFKNKQSHQETYAIGGEKDAVLQQ